QGVLPALDVIASSLRKALRRSELGAGTVVPGRAEPSGTRRIAHAAMTFARRYVPERILFQVGVANSDGFDRFALTCYGCSDSPANYDIVVGEAGLHCATSGSVAGRTCDLDDY